MKIEHNKHYQQFQEKFTHKNIYYKLTMYISQKADFH